MGGSTTGCCSIRYCGPRVDTVYKSVLRPHIVVFTALSTSVTKQKIMSPQSSPPSWPSPPAKDKKQSLANGDAAAGTSSQPSPESSRRGGITGERSGSIMRPEAPADVKVVRDLLSAMKTTLGVVESTLESLGDNSTKVLEMCPAIDAAQQVSLPRINYRILVASYVVLDVTFEKGGRLADSAR